MAQHETEAEFVEHEPCPKCGSEDNLARYDDGHGWCFGCSYYDPPPDGEGERPASIRETNKKAKTAKDKLIAIGDPTGWKSRKITEETAKKWGFTRSEYNGEVVRVWNFRDPVTKQIVAQKVRPRDKKGMRMLGPGRRDNVLYGQHLWPKGGRKVVVTEGELDAMSVSQAQNHKWPVVSVPTGSQGAKKALTKNLEWLDSFDEVVLMFDMDDAGQDAVAECSPLFSPGKCKAASLPLKDANEMLQAGRGKEIIDAIWKAEEYRPDGIVSIDDIIDEIKEPVEWGLPWFLDSLTQATYGRRYGEVYAVGAGTGIGKTDFMTQQMLYDIHELGLTVGAIYLEQKPKETGKRVAGKLAGKRFHIPKEKADWTDAELDNAVESLKGKVYFYDSWGQTDWDTVKTNIRYMAVALGIKVFYLDHLTAMADTSNEKESIEQLMKEMAGLANELGIIIHFVSHLSTPVGTPHEEGGRVMIRHFKGSRSIGFWSFFMFGLERNPHDEDKEVATTTTFRVLKDRYTGDSTGETIYLGYDKDTGRLYEKEDYDPDRKDSDTYGNPFGADSSDLDDDIPF